MRPEPEGGDFVPTAAWTDVGVDTPAHGFQSFLAVLKTGDEAAIESRLHWNVRWKATVTEEDKKLVEKSKHDYLEMLRRAPHKISAVRVNSIAGRGDDRKRVYFTSRKNDGTLVDSSLEMIRTDAGWKPVLSMGWLGFGTTAVFGGEIDLEK